MFTYTVKPVPEDEGGPGGPELKVEADSRDVLRWERAKSGRSLAKLLAEPTLSDNYVLAYLAAARQKIVDCSPQEFEAKYLLVLGADPAPVPTNPAP